MEIKFPRKIHENPHSEYFSHPHRISLYAPRVR